MICFPNAKINLGLSVTEKRADGYHNIETVFYPVLLRDALEIVPSEGGNTEIQLSGLPVPGNGSENLCLKAYHLLEKDYHLPPVKIYLLKGIPVGAGLGGGSSDAVNMIKLLNKTFLLNISSEKMQDYARQLGSDCAFFIENKAVFAYERGDMFRKTEVDLSNYHIAIVKPPVHVSTVAAYAGIKPGKPIHTVEEVIHLPVSDWKGRLINDFENTVFAQYPEIKSIKERFYALGAVYVSMSGSGSAVYGLFNERVELKNLFPECFVWEG